MKKLSRMHKGLRLSSKAFMLAKQWRLISLNFIPFDTIISSDQKNCSQANK